MIALLALLPEEPGDRLRVALQPYGRVPAAHIRATAQALERTYAVRVGILPARPLPKAAYYPPRARYRADRLLIELAKIRPARYSKILGLTSVDVSTTMPGRTDWGLFGLGNLGGPACVVSSFRMRGNATPAKLQERVAKVAVHELGHTFGRDHCPSDRCVMNDARGKMATVDRARPVPCSDCRDAMGR